MDEMEEMRMKDLMNIEDQIRDLERSPEVRLARQYEQIRDRRLFIIVRNYYALGWTDERIAENMELSRQTVQKVRSDYFNSLA